MPLSAGGRRCKRVQVDKCQILALLGREGFFRATHPGHPIQLFVRASIDEEAPMNVRYRVELSQTERAELAALLSGDKRSARKLKRAQILLAADGGPATLDRRIATREHLISEIAIWERQRNASGARIKWMFTAEKAVPKWLVPTQRPLQSTNLKPKSQNHCAVVLGSTAG